MSGSQQLQQLSEELQQIEAAIGALETEIEGLRSEQLEIDGAIEAIEELESGSTVQVPLGGGAYVRAAVDDIDEVIVDLGANYAVEQEQGDAIDALESKRDGIDDRIEELNEELTELESESEQLERRAQQMQQQLQQQQMQGMQGGRDEGA